jgi:NitT/TauT family transport system permease protein
MAAQITFKNIFLPNRAIDTKMAAGIVVFWIAIAALVWFTLPFATLPTPGEVWHALGYLWNEEGMSQDLFTTLKLLFHALFLTVIISLVLSYATVVPFFRPVVQGVSKLRFLGLTGLVTPFAMITHDGYTLKVWLLTFGMTTYFVTSMAQVVVEIPRENFDHLRALGAGEIRTLWEVVILGTLDKAFEVLRQNFAIGWTMITMVEGISRAEGGVGALILNQNKHFRLDAVFAILFVILVVGLLIDYIVGALTRVACPYANLERMRR